MSNPHKIAFMFSGQGSQYARMGKELSDNFPVCRDVFQEADEALGLKISDIINNDDIRLHATEFTQPALLTTCYAIYRLLQTSGVNADYLLGLSLGEYTALTAAGAFEFSDAVMLVRKRGRFMTEAVPQGKGAMSAVFNLDRKTIEDVCLALTDELKKLVCPANYNMPGQIVIAGETEAVEKAETVLLEKGAKRCVRLQVSGPFHTKLLEPAAVKLENELKATAIHQMKIPVISNLTGEVIPDTKSILPTLVRQVMSPVLWEDSLKKLVSLGVGTFVELGPGRTLSVFAKSTGKTILNIEDVNSFVKTIQKLQGAKNE